jgi:hypothetical protein
MPKRLPDRWRPECIREFRLSARERFDAGVALAAAGRRTGAIYLWGYCAEMLLKAAYFSVIGVAPDTLIDWKLSILPAIERAKKQFQIGWPSKGQGHNIRAWAELLVAERVDLGTAYPVPFGLAVQRQGQRIGQLWSETLRYHSNVAYLYEVAQIREATEWLLVNNDVL